MKFGGPVKIDSMRKDPDPEIQNRVVLNVSDNVAKHLLEFPSPHYWITDEDPNEPTETTGQNCASPEFLYAPFASVQDRPGRIHLPDDVPWQVIERSMRNETWTITVPDAGSRENAIKLADILNENERIRVNNS